MKEIFCSSPPSDGRERNWKEGTLPPSRCTGRPANSWFRASAYVLSLLCLTEGLIHPVSAAGATSDLHDPYLKGIGYREMELQTSKNTKFSSEEATGITQASFGGGTNIFIKGTGFDENP